MLSILKIGILKKIQTRYEAVEDARILKEVSGGVLSRNYILESKNRKFFLKQYHIDSIDKIKEIHTVKFFFANGGIPVVLPIRMRTGDYVFKYENEFYSMFPFVCGKILSYAGRSPKALASAGAMLGKVHSLSKDRCPKIVRNHEKGYSKIRFISELAEVRKKLSGVSRKTKFDKIAQKTLDLKECLARENTAVYEDLRLKNDHIIHGDYHGGNIFFDENNEVIWVFDLEKTEISPRVLELVRSMDFLSFSSGYKKKNFENARTYLSAYRSVYPIEDEEIIRGLKALYLKKVHSLWVKKEHYLNDNNRVDSFLEINLKMLEYYSENLPRLIEILLPGSVR